MVDGFRWAIDRPAGRLIMIDDSVPEMFHGMTERFRVFYCTDLLGGWEGVGGGWLGYARLVDPSGRAGLPRGMWEPGRGYWPNSVPRSTEPNVVTLLKRQILRHQSYLHVRKIESHFKAF